MQGSPLSACVAGIMQLEMWVSPGAVLLCPCGVWTPWRLLGAGFTEGAQDMPAPGASPLQIFTFPLEHR